MLELPVGLEHRVRVDGDAGDHVLDGGQLVALLEQPEAHGVPHLLDELHVGRDARAGVQMELNHRYL